MQITPEMKERALAAVKVQVLKEFGTLDGVEIHFTINPETGKVHYVIHRELARPWLADVG